MYGPRNAAGFSVQATRKKSSSERTKCSLSSLKNFVYTLVGLYLNRSVHTVLVLIATTSTKYQYQYPVLRAKYKLKLKNTTWYIYYYII